MNTLTRRFAAAAVAVAALGLAACGSEPQPTSSTVAVSSTTTVVEAAPAEPVPLTTAAPAPAGLAALVVAPESRAGYDRDLFGDYDRDALLQASQVEHGCYFSASDNTCHADAGAVEVDHVVALAEAWDSGASAWGPDQLDQFAGDPSNLQLLTAELNSSKQDDDAAEWVPPHQPAVCPYLATYVEVKVAWELTVDQAELAALQGSGCF
jgi:hypothetical protein